MKPPASGKQQLDVATAIVDQQPNATNRKPQDVFCSDRILILTKQKASTVLQKHSLDFSPSLFLIPLARVWNCHCYNNINSF